MIVNFQFEDRIFSVDRSYTFRHVFESCKMKWIGKTVHEKCKGIKWFRFNDRNILKLTKRWLKLLNRIISQFGRTKSDSGFKRILIHKIWTDLLNSRKYRHSFFNSELLREEWRIIERRCMSDRNQLLSYIGSMI